jgi:hypothetical protein
MTIAVRQPGSPLRKFRIGHRNRLRIGFCHAIRNTLAGRIVHIACIPNIVDEKKGFQEDRL